MELTEETGVNKPREFKLSEVERHKLINRIQAEYSNPNTSSIEGSCWETIFSDVKSIPVQHKTSRLFDVVDTKKKIGWSAKTLSVGNSITIGNSFTVVIQRSNIFANATDLGFPELSLTSPTEMLGKALIKFWSNSKIQEDKTFQQVEDARVCILIKSKDKTTFAYYEDTLEVPKEEELVWSWKNEENKETLHGTRISDGFLKYTWNPNQRQFREHLVIPDHVMIFKIMPIRLSMDTFTSLIVKEIKKQQKPAKLSFKQSLVFWYKNIVGRISSLMDTVTAKVVAA